MWLLRNWRGLDPGSSHPTHSIRTPQGLGDLLYQSQNYAMTIERSQEVSRLEGLIGRCESDEMIGSQRSSSSNW